MSKQLDEVNARLDALEPRVTTLETEVADLDDPAAVTAVVEREAKLEDRVSALESHFPVVNDGGAPVSDNPVSDSVSVDAAPDTAPSQSVL